MKRHTSIVILAAALVVSGAAVSAEKKAGQAHDLAAISDHLSMAEAHTAAAKCLQKGTPEKQCHAQLEKDCKGLGIGKYCGMKHKH